MRIILMIGDAGHWISIMSHIPREGELVRYDKKTYIVDKVIYNLDLEEVHVLLEKTI